MRLEEKIIGMLEQILEKQEEHSEKLDEHSQKLDTQESILKEHGQILTALRSGQEYLKAEIDGLKVSTAKEFGNLKEKMEMHTEIFRDELWKQKEDIYRIKTTMGMK